MTTRLPRANRTYSVPRWIKARLSDNANACVEVMISDAHYVRDGKNAPTGPVLRLDDSEWVQLCEILLNTGADERSRPQPAVTIGSISAAVHPDGHLELTGLTPTEPHVPATLRFTPIEHECFIDGLRNGEFGAPYVSTS